MKSTPFCILRVSCPRIPKRSTKYVAHSRHVAISSVSKILFLATLLCLVGSPTQAQVNIEKLRDLELDEASASLNASLALLTGNVEALNASLGARFDYKKGKHYSFIVGIVSYGEVGKSPFTERWFGHIRYNYRLKNWLVAELFGQVERDRFTLLQVRLLAGIGLRFRHLHGKQVGVFQGTAYMVEYEDINSEAAGDHPATVRVSRWSNYVNVRLILNAQTFLISTVYLQPRLDAFGDIRILNETTLAFALSSHLTFTASYSLHYDSRPPGEVKNVDLSLQNGLTIQF